MPKLFRFDTRKTKPKIRALAVISTITAAIVAVLLITRAPLIPIAAVLCAYSLVAAILLCVAFVQQIQYNPYSYNTIYYSAFALLALSQAITQASTIYLYTRDSMTGEPMVFAAIGGLMSSAKLYMLFSAPFILLFSAALCISNLSLIRHEGFRFVNVLGILLSVCMVGGELFLFFSDMYASGSLYDIIAHDLFTNTFAALYLYVECMLIGTIVANLVVVGREPDLDRDYLIILGCGIRDDGTPMPLLAGRVDRALAFYRKQLEQTGKAPVFVPSGGQGPDEVISEAESMRNYLVAQGVPAEHILIESRSTSTYENMRFSKEVIEATGRPGKVAFSTTNYHVFRAGIMARRVKLRAQGMGAKTKWYFWPNADVREFVGILADHRLKQAAIIGGMVAFYAIITLVYYLAL